MLHSPQARGPVADSRHRRRRTTVLIWLVTLEIGLGACGGDHLENIIGAPSVPPMVFTAPTQLNGTVGLPFAFSFCQPALTESAALCTTGAMTPTGGNPPYRFQLNSGTGFPPIGITLGLNGILSGIPSAAGTSTFSVCAVDLSGTSKCQTVTMVVVGTIALEKVTWSCTISASPLPGWRGCTGTVVVNISRPVPSGFVSAFFNYPTAGAFFRGELSVGTSSTPRSVTINVTNDYVSHCVASFPSSVDLYDGRLSGGATLIVRIPITITGNC